MADQTPFLADGCFSETGLALRQTDISGLAAFVTLYPETAPEAIHTTHAKLVWNAYRHHKTPEAISDAVDLPVSICRKHLVELGFLAEPRPEPITYKSRSDRPTWSALQRNQHLAVDKEDKGCRKKNA